MKSLRAQLILSHVLPQVIILPLLIIGLGYLIESQVLLADLANNFRRAAMLAAQDAAARPEIWQDAGLAENFARQFSDSQQRELVILTPDGDVQAAPSGETEQLEKLSPEDLAVLLSGQVLVKSSYSISLDGIQVEAFAPVLDTRQAVVGIVRITDRLGNVYENIWTVRRLELAALLLSMLAAVGLGTWLAGRLDLRLRSLAAAVEQVANEDAAAAAAGSSRPVVPPENMPVEFARVFTAVSSLSDRLRASEDARKRLLANLVHEVARPLGALQAAAHALQRGAVENPTLRSKILQGMDDQIERLKPLLDNLASLYLLSGQPVELQPVTVNPGEWLPEVLATWQAAALAGGLRWQCDLPEDLPVINLDPNRMAQVVGNLVANAIKYTPEGGSVHISAGTSSGKLWISVEDTGIGIPEEDRQKIFEPLFRGQQARRFPQGMGLGLSIAMDIVRLHGGDLQVSSEIGRGSCFTVYLPLDNSPAL